MRNMDPRGRYTTDLNHREAGSPADEDPEPNIWNEERERDREEHSSDILVVVGQKQKNSIREVERGFFFFNRFIFL